MALTAPTSTPGIVAIVRAAATTSSAVIATGGVRSAIGLNAAETAMMLRAGSAAMAECALVDSKGEPITACMQPTLDPKLVGWERAGHLATAAMREAVAPFGKAMADLRTKLVLCIDEPSKTAVADAPRGAFGETIQPAAPMVGFVHDRAKEMITAKIPISLCARGNAGPATIMDDLVASLDRGEHDAIVLGGVHTDYDPARIAELEAQGRLYSSENLDALIPGECAAFVVLVRPDLARRLRIPQHASILSWAHAWDEATPENDHSAMEALGITTAVKTATQPMVDAGIKVGWSMTDMTFEMWRVHDWQTMLIRTRNAWGEPYIVESPSQRLGNLGAAMMPFATAMVHEGGRRAIAPDARCVVTAGSDGGARGAIALATAS